MVNGTEPAGGEAARPGSAAAVLERLAAAEDGIRDDRHRQPPEVVEAIARLWAAGETVAGITARTGISREIVRDRLRRAGALEYLFRNQHRHVRDVLERRGPEFIAAYQDGAAISALANRAGVSSYTIRTFLLAHGIALRTPPHQRARAILEARSDELIAAYEAGASLDALAAGIGITPYMVRAHLVARGVAIRDYPRRAREIFGAHGAEMIAAYQAGASISTLAAGAGVTRSTMRAYLVAHGIAIRTPRRRTREIFEAHTDELIAAYEAGATFEELAAGTGIGAYTLRKYLEAEGVVSRNRRRRTREMLEASGAELVAAYESGASIRGLAAEAGVSSPAIRAFLIARGVTLRHDPGGYGPRSGHRTGRGDGR